MRTTNLTGLLKGPINAYDDASAARKAEFHKDAKLVLKRLAGALGLAPGSYDLRSNKAGFGICGEVTLHTDRYYVQVGQSCMGPRGDVLFRLCDGRKDYCGKTNHFASGETLETDISGFADRLRWLK